MTLRLRLALAFGPLALLLAVLGVVGYRMLDRTGDRIDATLCAMQAAWAWQRRASNYGLPDIIDPLEGWIATVPQKQ